MLSPQVVVHIMHSHIKIGPRNQETMFATGQYPRTIRLRSPVAARRLGDVRMEALAPLHLGVQLPARVTMHGVVRHGVPQDGQRGQRHLPVGPVTDRSQIGGLGQHLDVPHSARNESPVRTATTFRANGGRGS